MPFDATSTSANVLLTSGELDANQAYTDLHLPDGRIVRLPTGLLRQGGSEPMEAAGDSTGAYWDGGAASLHSQTDDITLADDGSYVIPLVEEQLQVGKRVVPTGKVLLHKTVATYETHLDEPLAVRAFDIERILLNQPVESAPPVRQEGDTTVYPLVEEQLILTKQLILKEEVRVTRRDTERRDTQTVTLRREHLTVERDPTA